MTPATHRGIPDRRAAVAVARHRDDLTETALCVEGKRRLAAGRKEKVVG
jgi:hypothetical protein